MTPELLEEYTDLEINAFSMVGGGNTSAAYRIEGAQDIYFLKEKEIEGCAGLFEKEADGLEMLANNSRLIIPKVLKKGISGQKQFILLSWLGEIEPGKKSWSEFGSALAAMHRAKQPYFGFNENNYLGSLPQVNTPHSKWSSFYSECRLQPFAIRLFETGLLDNRDMKALENLCASLPEIFPGEHASLLHGDLWSGNFMFTANGPAIFDPAVYFGHREMDIGMSLLFRGFDTEFYESYNQTYPLADGWRQRVPYTQLYPLLAHAVFFGGHYVSQVKKTISKFQQ